MSSRGDMKEEKVRRKLSTNSESVHGVGGRWYLNESSKHINCPRFNDPTMDIDLMNFLHPLEITYQWLCGGSVFVPVALWCLPSPWEPPLQPSHVLLSTEWQWPADMQPLTPQRQDRFSFFFFTHAKFWCGHVLKDDTSRAWFSA